VEVDNAKIEEDLDNHWEVLAEPIQTVMRKYQMENPYEVLKEMTRGRKIDKKVLTEFIQTLKLPEAEKKKMLELTPKSYIGNAVEMSDVAKFM
jgi:adenylosuccinate lyase